VAVLHAGFIYALAAGLAQQIYQKGIEEIKVAVEQPKIEKAPPPPPPDLAKPPPPYVPPPEINIQMEAPSTTAITTQNKIATPAPPPPVAATGPKPTHAKNCDEGYPEEARRLNQEGKVLVQFTVETDGSTTNVSVAGTSGNPSLDQAAAKCISGWRWKPAEQAGGQPIAKTLQMYIKYQLHGGGAG
jgi:protein TonB